MLKASRACESLNVYRTAGLAKTVWWQLTVSLVGFKIVLDHVVDYFGYGIMLTKG
jgi:hypothetical protein